MNSNVTTAATNALIKKIAAKPPLSILRRKLIYELDNQSIIWITKRYSQSSEWHDYVRKNRAEEYSYDEYSAPYWTYKMWDRIDNYSGKFDKIYNNIKTTNEQVKYDYIMSTHGDMFIYVEFPEDEKKMFLKKTKESLWREVQREKIVMLYGKVPTDVINEMLSYVVF